MVIRALSGALAALLAAAPPAAAGDSPAPPAGEPGGPGLALRAAKALTARWEGDPVVDQAVLLVRDGRIEALGPAASVEVPAGYEVRDLGARWLMPGMVDLHNHVGGTMDINDMVLLINPELRARASIVPANPNFERALAGGVTTVLFIPGSGTNSSGQGILIKTGEGRYEDALVRDPGSLKIAQWGNPERWTIGVGKTVENWNLRNMFRRGLNYDRAWRDFEEGRGEEPEKDPQWEVFRELKAGRTQCSVHTQLYQVVLTTLTMIKGEFDLPVYTDHSEIGGWLTGKLAARMKVPAIIGPRSIDTPLMMGWLGSNGGTVERIQGLAAGYQSQGHELIGFNTDAPVIPAEELFLQSALAVRYGLENSRAATVRGLTIVPAMAAGIDQRVGSLEPGKDADLLVISGDPSDPRTSVELVFIEGRIAYDASVERRF